MMQIGQWNVRSNISHSKTNESLFTLTSFILGKILMTSPVLVDTTMLLPSPSCTSTLSIFLMKTKPSHINCLNIIYELLSSAIITNKKNQHFLKIFWAHQITHNHICHNYIYYHKYNDFQHFKLHFKWSQNRSF